MVATYSNGVWDGLANVMVAVWGKLADKALRQLRAAEIMTMAEAMIASGTVVIIIALPVGAFTVAALGAMIGLAGVFCGIIAGAFYPESRIMRTQNDKTL